MRTLAELTNLDMTDLLDLAAELEISRRDFYRRQYFRTGQTEASRNILRRNLAILVGGALNAQTPNPDEN